MKKIVLLFALSMIFLNAQAADWEVVGQNDASNLKLDKDSIKEINGIKQVWSMWNFQEPRKNAGDIGFPTFKSYKDLTEYNCAAKTMRLTKEILYQGNDGAGDMRDHSDALKNSKFVTPIKDSLADGIMRNFICTGT
ncbi:surface-adhesin E family protein [Glaciimonas sp. GG7]